MAIACFGLVTFLPLRPDLNLPCFISRISVSTFFPADGEYLWFEDFLDELFFAVLRRVLLLFFALLDFFLVAFFVAITILPRRSDGLAGEASCTRAFLY